MAEAIGLLASIIAVAGLAKTALRVVKEIQSIARDLETVRDDLVHSISRVGFSAATIISARRTLLRYYEKHKTSEHSIFIEIVETQRALDYLEHQSSYMRNQLDQIKFEIYSLLGRWRMLVTLKRRYSLKKEIDAFQLEMSFVQVNLTLVLNSVRLEMKLNEGARDEIEMQVRFLFLKLLVL